VGIRDGNTVNPRARSAAIALLFIVLTMAMTWPQTRYLNTRVADVDDPLLSIWRISWIAHILPQRPTDLFNGNIFHPERRTLAYTDAVLLQGFTGAPLIWSGISRVTTYNTLLLLSIALSGWAMWRLALHFTGDALASVLAGTVFAFVPYRFDHFAHLELQATIFLPLTLLYFDRAVTGGSRRDAWLTMIAFVGQVYTCIYYSIFLATALVPLAVFRVSTVTPGERRRFLRNIAAPVLIALLAVSPYAITYSLNRDALGERVDRDVLLYSATITNYLGSPASNVLHGGWSGAFGAAERCLFPGIIAIVLAIVGVARLDRHRISLAIVGISGLIISLGLHSPFYEVLRAIAFPYRGLRAPARASVLVFLAIAALVAFGWARLMRGRSQRTVVIATALLAAAMLLEYRTRLDHWLELPSQPAEVYRWLAAQPRAVIAEVPFARLDRLHSLSDGIYMFNSTWHWHPIVNGYSGFFPKTFYELVENTIAFPDDRSIDYLKSRGVDLIVVHGSLMDRQAFGEMTATLLARSDIEAMAQFQEPRGTDTVFRLRR
jgi:hypothetical protein